MTSRDDCLIRHLLYASVQAYHLDPLYSGAPRWTAGPDPIGGNGPRPDIDLALVGTFREGAVVAFRGNLPPLDLDPDLRRIKPPDANLLAFAADWIDDPNHLVTLTPRPTDVAPIDIPGAIHQGFANSLAALWPKVAAAIAPLAENKTRPIYFTGHGRGGALANLAALAARRTWWGMVRVVTFGAPRAGDEEFARAYGAIDCHRYEVVGDPVPDALQEGWTRNSGRRALFAVGVQLLRAPIYHWPGGSFSSPDDRWKIPPPIAAHLPYPGFGYGDHVCMDGLCSHDFTVADRAHAAR